MTPAAFVLWGCALLVVYVWAGYPGLLWALARPTRDPDRVPSPRRGSEEAPSVTIVVAVYNEEVALPAKLEDCLRASYPRNKLDVMVASDGSTDGTVRIGNEFARRDGRVDMYVQEKRMGKTAVQNAAVGRARGDVIVFSDVDTRFDVRCLERLTEPFADRRVGCVTGALVWTNPAESAVSSGGDV
jgi:cellulose synthase/poly-beta-1,6-N-acetylglucosamine synthase-like glycosyltransferase